MITLVDITWSFITLVMKNESKMKNIIAWRKEKTLLNEKNEWVPLSRSSLSKHEIIRSLCHCIVRQFFSLQTKNCHGNCFVQKTLLKVRKKNRFVIGSASENTSYYNANNNLGVAHLSSSKEPPEHQHVYLVCPRGLGGGWSPRPYLRSSDRGVHQELWKGR